MTSVPPSRHTIVLKASRETLLLLAATGGLTLALSQAVHNRAAPVPPRAETAASDGWTGGLAKLAPSGPVEPATTLSSDALTVPKATMALPAVPRAAAAPLAKPRLCDGAPCPAPAKAAALPAAPTLAPPHRALPPVRPMQEASLMDRLNPLQHMPDLVKRPFASATDAVAGWVKRF